MNRRHARVLGGSALVLALAAGAFGVSVGTHRTKAEVVSAPRASAFHFTWTAGSEYLYSLRWSSDETVRLDLSGGHGAGDHEATPIAGSIDLAAKLRLRAIAPRDDGWLLAATIVDVESARVSIGEQRLEGDAARGVLGDREMQIEIGPEGRVRSTFFDPESPTLFKHVAQTLFTELSLTMPEATELAAGGTWEAKEETSLGTAQSTYRVDDAAAIALVRTRARYDALRGVPQGVAAQAVESRASIGLDPSGYLQSFDLRESVSATAGATKVLESREQLGLALVAVGRFDLGATQPVAALEQRKAGEVWGSPELRKHMIEQRVDGLGEGELLASVTLAGDGKLPDEERFLWRASGFLALHPEACRAVGDLAARAGAKSGERAMALDLLAAVGHVEAQKALRTALGSDAVKGDPDHALLLQRVSLVEHPERATTALVSDAYVEASRRGRTDDRWASAYTLGAIASHLSENGDDHGAHAAVASLQADLARATTPEAKAQLLTAVGSAGLADNVPMVVGYASSDDDEVRRAAAAAMFKNDTPEVRAALVSLVADRSPSVEATAINALDHKEMGEGDVTSLAAQVLAGATHRRNDPMLVSLLATHAAWGEPARRMLEYLLARNGDDAALEARIRAALGA